MTMTDCGSGTTIHSCLDLLGFSSAPVVQEFVAKDHLARLERTAISLMH